MSIKTSKYERMKCDGCGKVIPDRFELQGKKYFCSGKLEAPLTGSYGLRFTPDGVGGDREVDFCKSCYKEAIRTMIKLIQRSLRDKS